MVWTCHEERSGVCRKKGDGNGVTGKEEKREAEKKISGCNEEGYKKLGEKKTNVINRLTIRRDLAGTIPVLRPCPNVPAGRSKSPN